MPYSLISHPSFVFYVYSTVSETESSLKEYIVYATSPQNLGPHIDNI